MMTGRALMSVLVLCVAAGIAGVAAQSSDDPQVCANRASFGPDVSWEYGCSKTTPDNGASEPPAGWCPAGCWVDHYAPNFACSCNGLVTSSEECSAMLPGETRAATGASKHVCSCGQCARGATGAYTWLHAIAA